MSEYLMTAGVLAGKCLALAKDYRTAYALGMWGFRLTRGAIDSKAAQYPGFYTAKKKAELYALADKGDCWGFDCVCMIKALLWGWDGSDSPRGGAVYASNGVPDFGADGIGKYCAGFTGDFSQIEPGEALWMPGHVGVYVGGGLAVECTAAWESKVIVTAVGNIGKVDGFHTRTWTKHGRLKWINYKEEDQPMTPDEKKALEALTEKVASLGTGVKELGREVAAVKESLADFEKRLADLEKRTAEISKTVDKHSGQLKVYHYWSQIKKELPWAYKPLRALYDAGFFSGASAKDLNVCRVKIETLVSLAAALRKLGEITY